MGVQNLHKNKIKSPCSPTLETPSMRLSLLAFSLCINESVCGGMWFNKVEIPLNLKFLIVMYCIKSISWSLNIILDHDFAQA